MLYSTIEEAWNKPSYIESFSSKDELNQTCDTIISQLLKCDGCLEKVKKQLNVRNDPLRDVIEGFTQSVANYDRVAMRKCMLLFAVLLVFALLIIG